MKKLLALLLVAIMLAPMMAFAASEYAVTEPITIKWWHAHEDQYNEYLTYMTDKFNAENGMGITVEPVYIGAYAEINTQFIAAAAAGTVSAALALPFTASRAAMSSRPAWLARLRCRRVCTSLPSPSSPLTSVLTRRSEAQSAGDDGAVS